MDAKGTIKTRKYIRNNIFYSVIFLARSIILNDINKYIIVLEDRERGREKLGDILSVMYFYTIF